MQQISHTIRTWISEGALEEALQAVVEFLRERGGALYDECLQHQGKLSELNRNLRLGLLRQEDIDLTRNRIRYALLEIARELEHREWPAAPGPVVVLTAPPPPPAQQAAPAGAPVLQTAHDLIGRLQRFLNGSSAEPLAALFHASLLNEGALLPAFYENNFRPAQQRISAYCQPVEITQAKHTGRTAVGVLHHREEGDEYVFYLRKIQDTGGMPGMVRIFFPQDGSPAKITNLSL